MKTSQIPSVCRINRSCVTARRFLLAALFCLPLFLPASMRAQVTVQFSDPIQQAAGKDTQETIQNLINAGLKKQSKDNPGAKDLYDSKQTIKIICSDEPKAKDEKVDFGESGFLPEFGKTKGDFIPSGKPDAGKPTPGGTAYIAINCDHLKNFGWFRTFDALGGKLCIWNVLVHEFLHATNAARIHGGENDTDTSLYDTWVTNFNDGIKEELKKAEKPVKEAKQKINKTKDNGDTGFNFGRNNDITLLGFNIYSIGGVLGGGNSDYMTENAGTGGTRLVDTGRDNPSGPGDLFEEVSTPATSTNHGLGDGFNG